MSMHLTNNEDLSPTFIDTRQSVKPKSQLKELTRLLLCYITYGCYYKIIAILHRQHFSLATIASVRSSSTNI